jgi:predicted dehydrogenase
MDTLRFAIFGAGFWSRYQLAAWQELDGVECAAVYNRTKAKADALAAEFGVPAVYDDPEALLDAERVDFIDVITDVDTHSRFVHLAAERRLPVICQKPMAPDLATAEAMVAKCREAGVWYAVHENWRWQAPVRALKAVLDEGAIGKVFRARLDFGNSFPVFDNQPFLAELEQFIITDIGSHVLDTARFLFGEPESVYCHTQRVHEQIRGEDVATVMMKTGGGATVLCEMSYATRREHDRFPETYAFVEGSEGSVELGPDYWIRVTGADGTYARRVPPLMHPWIDPLYALVQSSIVPCNRNLLESLRAGVPAETSGEDNLQTVRLMYAAYDSARERQVVTM